MIAAIHWAIAHNLDRAIAYLLHIDEQDEYLEAGGEGGLA